jgi:drug/metabolite transporter (DMT)-like permease
VITVLATAATYVAIPFALHGFTPAVLVTFRLTVATVVLSGVLWLRWLRGAVRPRAGKASSGARPRLSRQTLLRVAAGGAVGFAGYSLLINIGQQSVDAGTTSLLINASPLFSAILGVLLLGERQGRRGWAGLAIGFAGTGLVAFAGGSGTPHLSLAALCVLGAALATAVFAVIQLPVLQRLSPVEATAGAAFAGLLCSSYALPDTLHELTRASPSAIGAALFLGIGSTAIGYTAWAASMRRSGAGDGTAIFYAVPIVTIALEWIVLGSHPSVVGAAGGLLALAGVLYGRTDPGRTDRHPPEPAQPTPAPTPVR